MDQARKFLTLDALRGVAALAVVEFHTGRHIFRHGYLAVDFFFMLSGFVLTFAYQGRLDAGWTLKEFLKARFIRLYPLYLMGLFVGVGLRVIDVAIGRPSPSPAELLTLFVAGLLVLPAPAQFPYTSAFAFPLNIPSWSLFLEVLANVVHGVVLRRRSWRFIGTLALVAGAVFYGFAWRSDAQDIGGHRVELLPGLARVLFSYCVGMLLFKVWQTKRFRIGVPPVVAGGALMLLLMGPPARWGHALGYDMGATLVCFPGLLLLSAASQPAARWSEAFQALGIASYGIYVLHVPLAAAYFAALTKVLCARHFMALERWAAVGFLGVVLVAAMVVDRIYDVPLRRMLRRRWSGGAEQG